MNYHLNWLLQKYEANEALKYLFFWGHTPAKNGQVNQSCLSQWSGEGFEIEDIFYRTAEHWMMAEKARLFQDEEVLAKIIAAKTPGEAKKLGRQVRGFSQEIWETNRYEIVKKGNLHKFSQHEELRKFLLASSKRILVEASPVDRIWGIGRAKDHPTIAIPTTWKGLNLLGFALMEVRDILVS